MCTKNPKSPSSHSISVTLFKGLYLAGITFLGQTKNYLFLVCSLRILRYKMADQSVRTPPKKKINGRPLIIARKFLEANIFCLGLTFFHNHHNRSMVTVQLFCSSLHYAAKSTRNYLGAEPRLSI